MASRLKDPMATFMLIKEAIDSHRLTTPNLAGPIKHLQSLVDEGDLTAIYLTGQMYESEAKISHALKIYEMAISSSAGGLNSGIVLDNSLGDIWKAIGRLKAKAGDHVGAQVATEKCALEFDDPRAYYDLAKLYTLSSSENYEAYMLKAAVSGEPEAAHELGVLYHQQSRMASLIPSDKSPSERSNYLEKPNEESTLQDQSTISLFPQSEKGAQARDWLAVAAECDISISQLYLAILLRAMGKHEQSTEWLQKASKSKQWANATSWIRNRWDREESVDIDTTWKGELGIRGIALVAHDETMVITT